MSVISDQIYNGIIYRVATANDREAILDFLRKHYYPEEPITNGNEPKCQDIADEEFTLSVIADNASVVAVDPQTDGKIIGALMAGPIETDEVHHIMDMAAESESNNNRKWSQILLLLGHLAQCSNIFQRYNVDRSLHIHVMSVDTAYRGKSIGTYLMQMCFDVGKSLGYPIVSADCTNVFSIKIAEKLGMDCVNEMAFSDYKDIHGKQLFNPPLPHTHIKSFVKVL